MLVKGQMFLQKSNLEARQVLPNKATIIVNVQPLRCVQFKAFSELKSFNKKKHCLFIFSKISERKYADWFSFIVNISSGVKIINVSY